MKRPNSPQKRGGDANNHPIPLRRKIGLIAIGLAVLVVVGFFTHASQMLMGALIRTLLELVALWIAWPELVRLPRWVWLALPAVVIVGAFRPILLIYAIPLMLLILWLRPKK